MGQTIIAFNEGYRQIEGILEAHLSKRFLLVCGNSFQALRISEYFNSIKTPYSTFSEFTANPKSEQIEAGLHVFRTSCCDAIVAVGGGSAIDVAKCIRHYSGLDHILLITLPTTAGTGSESTSFAVLYKDGIKQSIETGLPDYAILEESVLENLPLYQKKATMLDALCQGIESIWSNLSTKKSRELSNQAIGLILDNHQEYLANEKPPKEVLRQMMLASNYSGQAINISKTTAAHAMSYGITSMFGLPHGYAVALCLVPFWRFLEGKLNIEIFNLPISVDLFEDLLKMYSVFPNHDCSLAQILKLSGTVNVERLHNSPIVPSSEDITNIYKAIFGQSNYFKYS